MSATATLVSIPERFMKRGRKGWVRIKHIRPGFRSTEHVFNGPVPRVYNTGWWRVCE